MSEVSVTVTDEMSAEAVDTIIKELELERRRAAEFGLIVESFTGYCDNHETRPNPEDPEVVGYMIRKYFANLEHAHHAMQREIANLTVQLRTERAVNHELTKRLRA